MNGIGAGSHPLFGDADPARPVFAGPTPVSQGQLLANAERLAERLPPGSHLFNLCGDRFHFCVALIAGLLAGKTLLLPVSRHPADLAAAARRYGSNCMVSDERSALDGVTCIRVDEIVDFGIETVAGNPSIQDDRVLAVAFTSGSTGAPDPHDKLWGTLANTARQLARRFGFTRHDCAVVATVPSQHMYGLEMTAMLMLQGGVALTRRQPFYPREVVGELAGLDEPVLVTTPVHLRALCEARTDDVRLGRIICATAPLSRELAQRAERKFSCHLEEIYGCTEAGSIATRRTVAEDDWCLLDGFEFAGSGDNSPLLVPYLPEPVRLADQIAMTDDGRFQLRGRNEDMLNVAGKRFSLAELNLAFQSIDGVRDAVAAVPPGSRHGRPAALVVSDLPVKSIAAALARRIDATFIPRPIIRVAEIPRNATGKVVGAEVLKLLARAGAP